MTAEHKRLYEECLNEYGKMMMLTHVMRETGYGRKKAEEWVADIPVYNLNGRTKKYRTADVTKKLAEAII
jgi:hypothetical protein